MGALEIFIAGFAVILVLIVFMQPILILNDTARDSLNNAGANMKYGTNSDGEVVEVGSGSALPDVTTALLWSIGLFIVLGFVVWIIRYGRGGQYDYE